MPSRFDLTNNVDHTRAANRAQVSLGSGRSRCDHTGENSTQRTAAISPAAARNRVSRMPTVWPSAPPIRAPVGTRPISSEFMAPFMRPCSGIGVAACLRLTRATPETVAPTLKRKLAAVRTTIMATAGPPAIGVARSLSPAIMTPMTMTRPTPTRPMTRSAAKAPSSKPTPPMENMMPKVTGSRTDSAVPARVTTRARWRGWSDMLVVTSWCLYRRSRASMRSTPISRRVAWNGWGNSYGDTGRR